MACHREVHWRPVTKSLTFISERKCSQRLAWENKREVKTGSFSPPGVGGVLHDNSLAAQQTCPARQDCGLTRVLHLAIR